MDIKELSVGNYVRTPYGVAIIEDLSLGTSSTLGTLVVKIKEDGKYYIKIFSVSDITPIPITPEFLQKNGFEWNKVAKTTTIKTIEKHKIKLTVSDDGFIVYYDYVDDDNPAFYCGLIKHIHRLQNFLSLCGIELDVKL